MSFDFNLHTHTILAEPWYANEGPNRRMVWHSFLKVPLHCLQCLVTQRNIVRVHTEHLLPSFSTRVFQVQIDGGKV